MKKILHPANYARRVISRLILPVLLMALVMNCSKSNNYSSSNNGYSSLSANDQTFINAATKANLEEIDAGNLAAIRSTSTRVIEFADTMASNHRVAQADLKRIADSLKVVLPTTPDSAYFKSKENLDTLTGSTFDSTYVTSQITAHQNAISIFQAETENGQNKSLMDYANRYLPIIQMHLTMADSLATKLEIPH